jgi:phospholipase/lecithinase/hemolysin
MKTMCWIRWITKTSLAMLLAIFGFSANVSATSYSSVVVYGDSLSDNGNLFAAVGMPGLPYYGGRRSNGPVAVEFLAQSLAVPLIDFAWIGATTGVGNYADGGTVTTLGSGPLPGMTTVYNATKGSLSPFVTNGLFVVWGGPNDILAPSPLDTTADDIIVRAVSNELSIITGLLGIGVTNILVPGMPDLGLTPYFRSLGQDAVSQGTAFTDAFNGLLQAELPQNVFYYDTASLIRSVVANPVDFGFTNVTDPCFDGITVCNDPNQYLFFDSFHPSSLAQAIIARGFESLVTVPEPATLALFGLGLVGLALRRRNRI